LKQRAVQAKKTLMYANLIPKSAAKFAQKYNKDAEAKLKRILYSEADDLDADDSPDMLCKKRFKTRLGGDDQDIYGRED
jgi:hypothetical protein